jgi:hypothetical protein
MEMELLIKLLPKDLNQLKYEKNVKETIFDELNEKKSN